MQNFIIKNYNNLCCKANQKDSTLFPSKNKKPQSSTSVVTKFSTLYSLLEKQSLQNFIRVSEEA